MQSPPSSPQPASAPQTPRNPVVTLPGGVPLEGVPQTSGEVTGLRARREMIRDQMERASNRRSSLARDLSVSGDRRLRDEARTGIQQRIDVLDQRIIQLEQDQATTERLLSHAPPQLLAQTIEGTAQGRDPRHSMSDDDAAILASGTFGAGVVLTLVLASLRQRLRRRRAGAAPQPSALANDPRLDRLTQSVDAIAEEVERIGEGQRFVTQLLAGRRDAGLLSADPERR